MFDGDRCPHGREADVRPDETPPRRRAPDASRQPITYRGRINRAPTSRSAMIRQADPIANAIALTLPARRWLRVPGRPERTRHLRELPDACAAAGSNS